jgi:tetratricopeptide (TPR) repeat protein
MGGAAKLISSAYKAIQQHDLDGAKTMLDQAKNLNSNQAYLWSTYGYYEFSRGEISESIVCYRKELEFHPDRYDVYGALANTQAILGHREDAKEALRSWAKRDGSNPQPTSALVAMLMDDGDAAGAVVAAEAGIAQLPEEKKKDERLQLILGRAQIAAGMKEKGHDTLLSLMKTTENPDMMNDSAYELADAGLELTLAESTTRTALGKMSDESKGWTLDESPQTLLAKSRMMMATWDTMGWILYREGKLEEAESYLKAAWMNAQSVTMAEHLGEVAVARGKKDEALATYELGIATISPYDMMGKRKPAGPEEKKLQGRADALRKAGVHSSVHDAPSRLREIRTVPLGAAKGLDGVAEYRLLLSGGKVVRAERTGTKELVGAEDRLKEAKFNEFWPAESEANLVRNGMLNCHSGVCELVLVP